MLNSELRRSFKLEDNEIVQNRVYRQLAKEGKFDELPETCAFSDPVIMEVWDDERLIKQEKVYGKFMGDFITKMSSQNVGLYCWQNARLPIPKIDFSEFKNGDVVEVVINSNEKIYGLLFKQNIDEIFLTFSYQSIKAKSILRKDIISITKIK